MKRLLIRLVLILAILFTSVTSSEALMQGWTPPEDYREDKAIEIVPETSQDNKDIDIEVTKDLNVEDMFGSEQVFPFEPGFS